MRMVPAEPRGAGRRSGMRAAVAVLVLASIGAAAVLCLLPLAAVGLLVLVKYAFGALPVLAGPLLAQLYRDRGAVDLPGIFGGVSTGRAGTVLASLGATLLCVTGGGFYAAGLRQPTRGGSVAALACLGVAALLGGAAVAACLAAALAILLWNCVRVPRGS